MKSAKLLLLFVPVATAAFAQKPKGIPVTLTADQWTCSPQKFGFTSVGGVPAMKILPGAGDPG